MSTFIKLAASASIALLSACGGGSVAPAAPAVPVVTSYPLLSGYNKRIANGFLTSYLVSGDCRGFATKKQLPPTSIVTFEGNPSAQPAKGFTLISYFDCTPVTSQSEYVNYYDSNYQLLGHALSSYDASTTLATPVEYGTLPAATNPLPSSAKVGDTAYLGTETIYTDSSRTTTVGYDFLSYVIESDAPSTTSAIINLITERYDTPGKNKLLFKQQARSRMVEDGTLTDLSIDVQYSTTSTTHLVFTVP